MQKLKQILAFAMTIVLLSACTANEQKYNYNIMTINVVPD